MTGADSTNAVHFRAQSRKGLSLPGALRIVIAAADAESDVDWNRDVRVVDLGLGGACLETAEPVAAGTVVELVIDAPHLWDPLTLSGSVAWERVLEHGGARLGVCFDHQTGASVRSLTELLEAAAFA
jgi:hypothetical protein